MEKIIAVVVMIAIVIGLIATVVLPYVSEMQNEGDEGINQLTAIGSSMNGALTGAQVKTEIKANRTKFNLPTDKLQKITVIGQDATGADATKEAALSGTGASTTAPDPAVINALSEVIPDKAMFEKKIETYYSGSAKTITYTLIKTQ